MAYLVILEALCYLGALSSALIARNTLRIKNKSFISKFFVAYFIIDFIMGSSDTFFLFKLERERYENSNRYVHSYIDAQFSEFLRI